MLLGNATGTITINAAPAIAAVRALSGSLNSLGRVRLGNAGIPQFVSGLKQGTSQLRAMATAATQTYSQVNKLASANLGTSIVRANADMKALLASTTQWAKLVAHPSTYDLGASYLKGGSAGRGDIAFRQMIADARLLGQSIKQVSADMARMAQIRVSTSIQLLAQSAKAAAAPLVQIAQNMMRIAGAKIGNVWSGFTSGLQRARADLQTVSNELKNLSAIQRGGIAASFGAPLALALRGALAEAVRVEQAVANINAALGGLGSEGVRELTRSMQELAIGSVFSATEVAQAGEILAKAGYDAEQIAGNMTKAVIDLAAATGSSMDVAARGIVQAMSIWDHELVGWENSVEDAAQAADILTVAANKSMADIEQIIYGMRNLGPIAGQLGVGFDEAAAAIAVFTNAGMRGADAGISLARGLENLSTPTAEATRLMKDLGIEAFDLRGNFVGFPALFAELNQGLNGLSDQARLAALSMIFGQEAADVMALAITQGRGAIDSMISSMEQEGVAAQQAALRVNTLAGAWQRFTENLARVGAGMMRPFLGALREGLDVINLVLGAIANIPAPISAAIGALASFAAGILAVTTALGAMQAVAGRIGIGAVIASITGGSTGLMVTARALGLIALRVSGLARLFSPLGLAVTLAAVAVGVLSKHFQNNAKEAAQDAAQIKSVADSTKVLAESIGMIKRSGNNQAFTFATQFSEQIGKVQKSFDSELKNFLEGHIWDDALRDGEGDYTNFAKRMADQLGHELDDTFANNTNWVDSLGESWDPEVLAANMNKALAQSFAAMSDPFVDQKAMQDQMNALLVAYNSVGSKMTFKDLISGLQGITAGATAAAAQARFLAAALEPLNKPRDLSWLEDDLLNAGEGKAAKDIMALNDVLGGMKKRRPSLELAMQARDSGSLDEFIYNAQRKEALALTQQQMDDVAASQDRINAAMRTGEYDNQAIIASVRELTDAYNANDITGEQFAQGMHDLAGNTHDFSLSMDDATQKQIDFYRQMAKQAEVMDAVAGTHMADHYNELADELENTSANMEKYARVAEEAAQAEQDLSENIDLAKSVMSIDTALDEFNAKGLGTNMSHLIGEFQNFNQVLDRTFNAIVSNTNAIAQNSQAIADWAENLIAARGEWSDLDELVKRGLITGKSGEYDVDTQYAKAQDAYDKIVAANERIQWAVKDIQATLAPILADMATKQADYMEEIAALPAAQQLVAVGYMDAATSARAFEVQALGAAAAVGELGPEGRRAFQNVIDGITATDPILTALLVDMGVLEDTIDASGNHTYTINWDGLEESKGQMDELIDSIQDLISILKDPLQIHLDTHELDEASEKIKDYIANYKEALDPELAGRGLPGEAQSKKGKMQQLIPQQVQEYRAPAPNVPQMPKGVGPTQISTNLPMVKEQIQQLQGELGKADSSMNTFNMNVGAKLGTMSATFQSKFSESATAVTTFTSTTGPALSMWGMTASMAIVLAMTTMTMAVTLAMIGMNMATSLAMTSMTLAVSMASAAMGMSINTFVSTSGIQMLTFLHSVQDGFGIAFPAIQTSVTTAMGQAGADIAVFTNESGAALQGFFDEVMGTAQAFAGDFPAAIGSAMAEASAAIDSEASTWAGIISSYEGAAYIAGLGVGIQAAVGVADGMLSMLGVVQNAAAQIIAAVELAMKFAAIVSSPSKLTARIGAFLTQGLGVGILGAVPYATSAARTAMNRVTGAMEDRANPVSAYYSRMGRSAGTAAASGGGTTVNIQAPLTVQGDVNGIDDIKQKWTDAAAQTIVPQIKSAIDLRILGQGGA